MRYVQRDYWTLKMLTSGKAEFLDLAGKAPRTPGELCLIFRAQELDS